MDDVDDDGHDDGGDGGDDDCDDDNNYEATDDDVDAANNTVHSRWKFAFPQFVLFWTFVIFLSVAAEMDARSELQCQARYTKTLDPRLRQGFWTTDEDVVC